MMPTPLTFLIVHGAYGHPEGNWFPWLKQALQAYGNVVIPQFPTPEGQNLDAWRAIAHRALAKSVPHETVLIGHSSGAIFVLRLAEETPQPFKAVFPVCPFARDLGNATFDPLNATFYTPAPDWKAIKRGAEKIIGFAGDNDPYVPLSTSRAVTDALDAELIVIEKGGHLNAESGYRALPLLLKEIRNIVGMP